MKEKWPRILNIVSTILIIVCLVMIFTLKNEVNDLKRVINQNQSMLQSNISSISSSLRNELDRQASLINDSGWTVAAIDTENKTVDIVGGGSLLQGLDRLIEDVTGVKTRLAKDPVKCVALGTGKVLRILNGMPEGVIDLARYRPRI